MIDHLYVATHEPFTCRLATPLWMRVESARHAATIELLKRKGIASMSGEERKALLRSEAIRIAALDCNRRPYASWSERNKVELAARKAIARRGGSST